MAKKRNTTTAKPVTKPVEVPPYLGKHYRVCVAPTVEDLAKEVDSMIAKSWRIAGGVAVDSKGFYQAMCKGG